jgi:hypothetical protein
MSAVPVPLVEPPFGFRWRAAPSTTSSTARAGSSTGEHHLRFRVLLHQPGAAALRPWRGAVDQEAAGLVCVLGVAGVTGVTGGAGRAVAQHAGQGVEQRRLAGAGGPQQEHALPRPDVQVKAADRGPGPSGMPPAPAAGRDGGRPDAR